MKNTKYLYDERVKPEGMISVSQIQTYLSCAKKWSYNYIDNITPRVDRTYLTIGKLCHKGMQAAMQSKWEYPNNDWSWWRKQGITAIEDEWHKYILNTDFLDEESILMDQLLIDAKSIFDQSFEEFEPWKYTVVTLFKDGKPIPALELHFKVPCPPSKGLHGYIDAILYDRDTGFTWCTDYKFRKSLSPVEDESYNLQNSVYSYVCNKMGINVTGTLTWQHLNTPASDPVILKDGKASRAKVKTTWDRYSKFLESNGLNPEDYRSEMEPKLKEIEWFRSTYEYRNPETVNRIWDTCIVPVAKEIKKAHGPKANNHPSLYPWNCKMCQYQSLCQAELRGYDVDSIRMMEYTVRGADQN